MKKFTSSAFNNRNMLPIIMAGAGITIIIFCIILFLPKNNESEKKLETEFETLKNRISMLERRIKVLEEQENSRMTQISALSEMVRGFNESSEFIQALPGEVENINKKIDHITQRQGNIEKKLAQSKKTSVKTKRNTVKKSKAAKKPAVKRSFKYHLVGDGDTLYSLSHKFGISVEKLRQLNKLSPDAYIQPGQKLIVGN